MREDYVLVDLTADLLPLKAVKAKSAGARLVQICAVNTETGYDLLYSFAEKYHFVTYKVPLKQDEEIVSISDIYPSASLYENEMRELFGVQVRHMMLNYKDRLYTIDAVTPIRLLSE
ncbi:MAG: NADH-quinone oxidoreductase subunit C [Clostridia bacterium]|nr:NADH-quinone oxidoreductase subunit C [Clostridia bacterium]